jgi:hypothetical protein
VNPINRVARYIIFSLVLTLVGAVFIAPATAAPAPNNLVSFTVPGSSGTLPLAINDYGVVTGWYDTTGVIGYNGFIREQSGNFTTFQFPGSNATTPVSINANGEVTGMRVLMVHRGRDLCGHAVEFSLPSTFPVARQFGL